MIIQRSKDMQYIEADKLQAKPDLYEGIESSQSWILKENFVFDLLEPYDRKISILDFGCGNGAFLARIKEKGFKNISGVDLSNYLLDKSIYHLTVNLNCETLPIEENSLDIVTAFQVLEHLENYFLILQETKRVLKPGGLFIIAVPNPFNIFYRLKFLFTGNMTGYTPENNHLLFLTRQVFVKTYLKDFILTKTFFGRGPVPMLGRLNFIPGVKLPARVRTLPRCEMFADRVCYVLKKKEENS